MQVKKFEAKSMKEALQLVKQELGPEAIILSAKDNKKSFGLAGTGSIEVTAAISERSLQKKKFTEDRLPDTSKEKFRATTAKNQRNLIESTITKYQNRKKKAVAEKENSKNPRPTFSPAVTAAAAAAAAVAFRPTTSKRYVDIRDDETADQDFAGRRVDDVLEEFARNDSHVLTDAANRNMNLGTKAPPLILPAESFAVTPQPDEVLSLKKEVEDLRSLLNQFQATGAKHVTRHPGADHGLSFELSSNFEKLQSAGIDQRFVVEILEQAEKSLNAFEKKKKSLIDAWVARYILSHVSVTNSWLGPNEQHKLHVFVGPAGHGKTAALVKSASQLVLTERKKVAILTADNFKVGATEQLKIYAQILNVPFEVIKHTVEFPKVLARYSSYDVILVDYPGFSLKEIGEIDQMRALLPAREIPKNVHLVLSCATKDVDAYEICHRYQITQFTDILVTKLDESFVHGFLYNIQRKTEKPLYAFGIGAKIPEDIELATRERVLDLIYKITKSNFNDGV